MPGMRACKGSGASPSPMGTPAPNGPSCRSADDDWWIPPGVCVLQFAGGASLDEITHDACSIHNWDTSSGGHVECMKNFLLE